MKPITFASLFTGFGLADIKAELAGATALWGIEKDADIAQVAVQNGLRVIGDDVRTVGYWAKLKRPDWLHASPPCVSASAANPNGTESRNDLAMATAVVRAIMGLLPAVVSIENVIPYRLYDSYQRIIGTLLSLGYSVRELWLNAADFGVPQQRQRLITIAVREGFPHLKVTHRPNAKRQQLPLFEELPIWRNWYDALTGKIPELGETDLFPQLPDDQLAPWQVERLGGGDLGDMLVGCGGYNASIVTRHKSEPAMTITANHNQTGIRALLIRVSTTSTNSPMAIGEGPAFTVTASMKPVRAIAGRRANQRIVRLSPRALARLQSLPDSYELPAATTLAVRGIGNGVPCLLMKEIVSQVANQCLRTA